ncbi:MAG: RluA family pseudouridine synthase, partial [Myxococcota bacterium]|nr:RluA family pseudouridine synthase [Myxococcota bacterium]
MRHRFVVTAGSRLDRAVVHHTSLLLHQVADLVKHGRVWVDGRVCRRLEQVLVEGAVVEVRAAPAEASPRGVTVRYRQDGLLVVDKPPGLPTQAPRGGTATHLHGLLQQEHAYVGLHHRLDTPASGLILFTLNRDLNAPVARMFREHAIERSYLAVVVGDPGVEGTWDQPISGQRAVTHWQRVGTSGGMSLLRVNLETGRTHQVRLHAVDAGHPLAGDRRHGGAAGRLAPRLALHAWRLAFVHPRNGKDVQVWSPPPPDLHALVTRLGWIEPGPK